jgi:hypothetical protein
MSFNAPCCHHRGHRADTRKRAGIMLSEGIVYNCFNCKFSTGWKPGSTLSPKFKTLCQWLGASSDTIKELTFEALKTEGEGYSPTQYVEQKIEFEEKTLPEGSMPINDWVNSGYLGEIADDLEPVIDYVYQRGFDPISENFYWSPTPGYANRVIIPFFYHGKIVGNTARKIGEGRPKYLSDQHPFFVYNVDSQIEEHKYVFVVEGPFDALSVGGVALLTNEVSDQQSRIINSIDKEVIVIPDQDQAGIILIEQAAKLGWKVSFPNWEDDIKDCADAVKRYGKLFVIVDAIETATDNPAKIEIEKRKLSNKFKDMEILDV